MNKVILMGRLTADSETRYTQGAEPAAVVRFGVAVRRKYKKEGEPDVDFINCVAFGKTGEFVSKYFKKGMMISLIGRLRVSAYKDKNGDKRISTDVIVEETYFAESKRAFESGQAGSVNTGGTFYGTGNMSDDDLPF